MVSSELELCFKSRGALASLGLELAQSVRQLRATQRSSVAFCESESGESGDQFLDRLLSAWERLSEDERRQLAEDAERMSRDT
jgi:hypothetical protein